MTSCLDSRHDPDPRPPESSSQQGLRTVLERGGAEPHVLQKSIQLRGLLPNMRRFQRAFWHVYRLLGAEALGHPKVLDRNPPLIRWDFGIAVFA